MLSSCNNLEKQNESYQELINTLCKACSYNLNSRGMKLLEEAASAISVAVDKINDLEQFISDSNCENDNEGECLKEVKTNCEKKEPIIEEENNENFSVYFSVNMNIAESHIIEAFEKVGLTNFVVDKLVNRINFAYGFVTFKNKQEFQAVTLSNINILIENCMLKIIPKTGIISTTDDGNSKSKKRKRRSDNTIK